MNKVSARFGEVKTGDSFFFSDAVLFFIWTVSFPKVAAKFLRLLTHYFQKDKISLLLFYPNKNLSLYKEFSNIE